MCGDTLNIVAIVSMLIKNRAELIAEGRNIEEKKARELLLGILEKTLADVDPCQLTEKALRKVDWRAYDKVWVVGAGKGTYRMALAAERVLGPKLAGGRINVPEAIKDGLLHSVEVTLAGHPFPTLAGMEGSRRILSLVEHAGARDLILGLFSGGASALLSLPAQGLTLEDKIAVTKLLLRTSATINEINTVRKHLSAVKGGRLAEHAKGKQFLSLYLSDVVGNDLSTVASGPTVADKTTFSQAVNVLKKYDLWYKVPQVVREHLEKGIKNLILETPKKEISGARNIIIGNHEILAKVAAQRGKEAGFKVKILTAELKGDTEKMAVKLLAQNAKKKPIFLGIATGETTFRVRTNSPGGRNQQMGLCVLNKIKKGEVFIAFDTDGVDGVGPEQVGGVLVDAATLAKSKEMKLDLRIASRNNDAFNFFAAVGGQIKTGFVGTNLGDLVLVAKV